MSSQTRSVTRTMQSIPITTTDGKGVILCYSPGFNDTDRVEMDIANAFDMIQSIHRAKRVKLVLILSKNGIGDRFGAVSKVISTLSRLFMGVSLDDSGFDVSPFAYVFKKFDIRHKNQLYKQFCSKRNNLTNEENPDQVFVVLVDGIIDKTRPTAHIVSPLDGDSHGELLSALMEGTWYDDPNTIFASFVSELSWDKLLLQLQLSYNHFQKALQQKYTQIIFFKLKQLAALGEFVPESCEVSKQPLGDNSSFFLNQHKALPLPLKIAAGFMIRLHSFESSIWQATGSVCSCLLGISVILFCHIFRWEDIYLIKLSALFLET